MFVGKSDKEGSYIPGDKTSSLIIPNLKLKWFKICYLDEFIPTINHFTALFFLLIKVYNNINYLINKNNILLYKKTKN